MSQRLLLEVSFDACMDEGSLDCFSRLHGWVRAALLLLDSTST